jgi:hypothetical protein
VNAEQVLDILEAFYAQPVAALRRRGRGRPRPSPWAFIRELRLGTGKVGRRKMRNSEGVNPSIAQPKHIKQRIDGWAYNTWPSCREAHAFEIKVSRSDFLSELAKPKKREAAMLVSNKFYFVTTEGVVRSPEEIPDGCGWMEVSERGIELHMEPTTDRELPENLPTYFVNSLIRRAGRVRD